MGEDFQSWCDVRAGVVSTSPELIYDAAEHYYIQVVNQVKDPQKHRDLETWLGSIRHKVAIARQLRLETTRAAVLREHLQDHPSTRGIRKYASDDAVLLARRLESDAQNEFQLLLACIYRLGYRKLVTYRGYRPMPQIRRSAEAQQR